jgi:hypothetical protein
MSAAAKCVLKRPLDRADNKEIMAVQMLCPNLRCRKMLSVPDTVRGKLVKCQHCQQNFRVPDAPKKPQAFGAPASNG